MHTAPGIILKQYRGGLGSACAAMAAPDWSALLNDVFRAKGDPDTLKESKAVKKALKKAVKHSAQTKEHLAASLKAFLVG